MILFSTESAYIDGYTQEYNGRSVLCIRERERDRAVTQLNTACHTVSLRAKSGVTSDCSFSFLSCRFYSKRIIESNWKRYRLFIFRLFF